MAPLKPKATKVAPTLRDPGRFVSLNRLGEILERNRATIDEWKNGGMPFVQADRSAGRDWVFGVAAVVKWREGVVAEKAKKEGMAQPRMPSWRTATLRPATARCSRSTT